jgi:UDP-glucose 4-epimerase
MTTKESLTLNLGTKHGTSVGEVLKAARSITGHAIPCSKQARRAGDPATLIADSTKAREILGWRPVYSDIQTIVKTAWDWRQKQVAQTALRPLPVPSLAAKPGLKVQDRRGPFIDGATQGI